MDSGASRHLVGDDTLLHDAVPCADGLTLPNDATLHVTKVGSVTFKLRVDDDIHEVTLSDVYFAPSLSKDLRLISCGQLKKRGCRLVHDDNGGKIIQGSRTVFEFTIVNDVCMVETVDYLRKDIKSKSLVGIVLSVVAKSSDLSEPHRGTLVQFSQRLGHLSYDSIERIAKDPSSGIKITNYDRPKCVTCSKGKGTRTEQPKKDSGENSPIDRIRGVICSDRNGPISPQDKRGNQYLVTFIEYKTTFVATHKNKAAPKFLHFVAWFEAEFNCKVRVTRTDGGGKYVTESVELFCKNAGIRRQKTEASTPQSNGKSERMNRTIFNMVRCMLFGSEVPLSHWSDAAEYAVYILNRSPTRANPNRASLLKLLTGKLPDYKMSSSLVLHGRFGAIRRNIPLCHSR